MGWLQSSSSSESVMEERKGRTKYTNDGGEVGVSLKKIIRGAAEQEVVE